MEGEDDIIPFKRKEDGENYQTSLTELQILLTVALSVVLLNMHRKVAFLREIYILLAICMH